MGYKTANLNSTSPIRITKTFLKTMNHYILLALLLATAVNAFTVQPSILSPQTTRSHNQWRQVSFMASDAEAEAERLREKARQLKEEVAALSGTSVEEVEEATKKEEEAKQVA